MKTSIVTLTTDFGARDYYAAAMKAVMLNINPDLSIVDITHEIGRHDIMQACFVIANTYHYFPKWSIHVIVVDPTVGSTRRPLVASINSHHFLAPDNGVLSGLYQDPEDIGVYGIDAEHYYLKPLSSTFEGRDVFAPVAAWLSKGVEIENFGEKIDDYVDLKLPAPVVDEEGQLEGEIIHVDAFGNLITNVTRAQFEDMLEEAAKHKFELRIGDVALSDLKRIYAECEKERPSLLFGSTSQLEVAAKQKSACELLHLDKGAKFTLKFM
ncbi:MAG: SAM-dependent chlorinase/fluorinase [Candidatus Coatesbacteria bacterium]|nr:SAM-dependent chlorinase/fluorinase [Candidatus Coatesbacteria bacterium]